ncbi:MAG TPA: DUF4301 family protein [Prolixibacteraceae bacterium]|nr:DUF4301 family protein [Bacteroidales bacterium]HNQ37845.1 DUF4301 family protein [Prolixibacteraceae bacterium]HPJ79257.1 DUF4301 family protein [Prolixibacteraceae bacterium]HRV89482.1 DUF4301 family protein [Prolixibacteraceae bacterium]
MFTVQDKAQMTTRGNDPEEVLKQIGYFRSGFPFLPVVEAASPGNGIFTPGHDEIDQLKCFYAEKCASGISVMKFVPASGAASRMFKALFTALDDLKSGKTEEEVLAGNKDAREFYSRISDFAFAGDLKSALASAGQPETLRTLLEFLLTSAGLNYGSLPKGLLLFHRYAGHCRTPFEEHLVEGARYARDAANVVKLHFTVSPEHESGFRDLLARIREAYEAEFGVTFDVGFSHQKPSTDTIAVDMNNEPFRENDGSLLFRPGGHGALLENLNDLDADLVFIKNIDNVVPDTLKEPTFTWKMVLAGMLLRVQEQLFRYQKELNEKYSHSIESGFLAEVASFLENTLHTRPDRNHYYTEKEELVEYLRQKLNRPLRVCGMVRNLGEPGGGPFWAMNQDGTVSLQIAESVQIDQHHPVQAAIARNATHFNPVDLVCGLRNYKGEKYDLMAFRDPQTGFISHKSKDGRDLKAQELPGLWNGAMSDWNTLFVEVPVETFNPVKTVNDLLREQHQ